MDTLSLIGRTTTLLQDDINNHENDLVNYLSKSRVLIVGAAGSIGQAVTYEVFKRNPQALHVVDISENNLVELVRNLRSTIGYNDCEFKTFAIDSSSVEFDALINSVKPYDYIFNLSALKHVRSESDPFTLMRMIDVNIFNSVKIAKTAIKHKSQKYFCVSTDKAANPVNMMGATKRIMEIYLRSISDEQKISMARFANVAFSDGSLLHGFNQRFIKKQPLTAPTDVKRYFVSPQESGQLCLLSALLGENRDIYFPKLSEQENMAKFSDIAIKYLKSLDYEPVLCHSEEEARRRSVDLIPNRKWPVYFFSSDTTGEKGYEEFFMKNEKVDLSKYAGLGVVKSNVDFNKNDLDDFSSRIHCMKKKLIWDKEELLELFHNLIPDFVHIEKGRYLDDKM